MARLEELTVGANVLGLSGNAPVTIVATRWHGSILRVTHRNVKGQLAEDMLYRDDESRLTLQQESLPWSFDADANMMRLTSEAYRINLAHLSKICIRRTGSHYRQYPSFAVAGTCSIHVTVSISYRFQI